LTRHPSRIRFCDPVTQAIEPLAHTTDTGKQLCMHQHCHWLAILVDDDAVIATLHLAEHRAKILAKMNGVYLLDHAPSRH
jgi:hypothetical protein